MAILVSSKLPPIKSISHTGDYTEQIEVLKDKTYRIVCVKCGKEIV